ncbi:hypothetical protein HK096_003056, partial [Nowakowskiella sp. JEL0078]
MNGFGGSPFRSVSNRGSALSFTTSETASSTSLDSNLSLAGKRVSEKLDGDKMPDLWESLKSTFHEEGFSQNELPKTEVLRSERFSALPEDLLVAIHASFVGLLPEINHAWFTVDNRLGLWNYNDRYSLLLISNDFMVWDDQDQIINCVALVKPVPGVFLEQIEYLLIVATALEVYLLGVAFEIPVTELIPGQSRGNLQLYMTGMSVPTDGIIVCSVASTESGRIFLCCKNGHIYEIQYQVIPVAAEEGWFTKRCVKIDKSSAAYMNFVPSFASWTKDDPISQVVIDETKNAMYVLFANSSIELVYLGQNGQAFERKGRFNDLLSQAQSALERSPVQYYIDPALFKIVSISTISPLESTSLNLIAITSTGFSLYLTCSRDYQGSDGLVPVNLKVLYVRPPVIQNIGRPIFIQSGAVTTIHAAYYASGLIVMANSVSEEADSVIGVAPDAGLGINHGSLVEQWNSIPLQGKTWGFAETPSIFSSSAKGQLGDGRLLNELATQLEYPRREILIMMNTGIAFLTKVRPIDILQRILRDKLG